MTTNRYVGAVLLAWTLAGCGKSSTDMASQIAHRTPSTPVWAVETSDGELLLAEKIQPIPEVLEDIPATETDAPGAQPFPEDADQ